MSHRCDTQPCEQRQAPAGGSAAQQQLELARALVWKQVEAAQAVAAQPQSGAASGTAPTKHELL